jgi:predicted metal-dependent peptidase
MGPVRLLIKGITMTIPDQLLAEAQKALSKAKIQLMARPDSVFFTTILFSLKCTFDLSIPTAATNGKWIKINPNFFLELNSEERVFLLLHEALHVAYLHMLRLLDRHPRRWNIAADYVINWQLVERGFKMPKVGLLDKQYAGMSTEQVYSLLPENPSQPCDMDLEPLTSEDGEAGEENTSPGKASTAAKEALEREVQDILVRASIHSKMAQDSPGTIPGEIQIFLDRLLNPKLPWQRILQKYLQSFAKQDYTFKRPNRRFFPRHHLPSLYSESLIDLAIAVDTSGSVSNADFLRFVSEIHSILRMMKPSKMTLLQFDTAIKSVHEIKDVNELSKVDFRGRGGTHIHPVLEWAEENKPQLLLIFTDGEFKFYQDHCPHQIVWLIHNNQGFKPPFGKTIHYHI